MLQKGNASFALFDLFDFFEFFQYCRVIFGITFVSKLHTACILISTDCIIINISNLSTFSYMMPRVKHRTRFWMYLIGVALL